MHGGLRRLPALPLRLPEGRQGRPIGPPPLTCQCSMMNMGDCCSKRMRAGTNHQTPAEARERSNEHFGDWSTSGRHRISVVQAPWRSIRSKVTRYSRLTTSGNQGSSVIKTREEVGATREAEALESAKLLDAEVRFIRYDDELLLDTLEARRRIINAMRWAQPDVILTHYPNDPSTDHTTTGNIVSKLMLSLMGKLIPADEPPVTKKVSLFYFDNAAGIDFCPRSMSTSPRPCRPNLRCCPSTRARSSGWAVSGTTRSRNTW